MISIGGSESVDEGGELAFSVTISNPVDVQGGWTADRRHGGRDGDDGGQRLHGAGQRRTLTLFAARFDERR